MKNLLDLTNQLNYEPFKYQDDNGYYMGEDVDPDNHFFNRLNINSLYYTEDKFKHKFCTYTNSNFSLIHFNCRSLSANFEKMVSCLSELEFNFDIIAVSETWLSDNNNNREYEIDGYVPYFCSRQNKKGGGVALYVNHLLQHKYLPNVSFCVENCAEFICIEVYLKNSRKVVVGCVYRAPNTNLGLFREKFDILCQTVGKSILYICGDFNVDLLNYDKHPETNSFVDEIFGAGLHPLITKPTRITLNTSTLIDNIFTTEMDFIIDSGIIVDDTSDHLPIFQICRYEENIIDIHINQKYKKRSLNDENINNLLLSLENINWESVFACENPNDAYNIFIDVIIRNYDRYCPVKWINCRNNSKTTKFRKPWITSTLRNACKKRKSLYQVYLKKKTLQSEECYKKYRNKLNSILRNAKVRYYSKLLDDVRNDVKQTWKILNSLTSKTRKTCNYPSEFNNNGEYVKEYKNIADAFNEYFVTVGSSLASKIPQCERKFDHYMDDKIDSSMFLNPVTDDEIVSLVKLTKPKMSKDCDDLSMKVVKNIIRSVVTPLTFICNLSFETGLFPDKLKIAMVSPLFKSGDNQCFSNYRPVSLLPQFSKIIERLFNNRLKSFIETKNILSNSQYGFRSNHSTSLAILELIEKISSSIDESLVTIGVFVDLKKAFDTINHEILLKKLEHYGLRGIVKNWMASYLTNRPQYVKFKNVCSEQRMVSCGVPQGSVLGPTLFLLYINDISNVSDLLNIILFADDTNLFLTGTDIDEMCRIMTTELTKLNIWFQVNKLSLNIQKTNFIIFGNKKCVNRNYNITIDGCNLERVLVTKFLGVYIDSQLNWAEHVKIIQKKVSKNIGILFKVQHLLDVTTLHNLYFTLISPYFYYCSEIWGNTYRNRIQPLFIMQKKALRLINKKDYSTHSGPLFFNSNILTLTDLVIFKTLSIMYKAKHNMLPSNVQALFQFGVQHNYETRQKQSFKYHYCRTTKKAMCISITGPKMWNNLDHDIRESDKPYVFTKLCKKMLLGKYQNI
jgi:hypothetical protein